MVPEHETGIPRVVPMLASTGVLGDNQPFQSRLKNSDSASGSIGTCFAAVRAILSN